MTRQHGFASAWSRKPISRELQRDDIGQHIFGSHTKMEAGIWIASREDDPNTFTVEQISSGLPHIDSVNIRSSLEKFCKLGILACDDRWVPYTYTAAESPLWGIFVATETALGDINFMQSSTET